MAHPQVHEREPERRHDDSEDDSRITGGGMAARWQFRRQLQDRRKGGDRRRGAEPGASDRRAAS